MLRVSVFFYLVSAGNTLVFHGPAHDLQLEYLFELYIFHGKAR